MRVASGLLMAMAVLACGCGKRGDPLPPLRPVPAAAEGLLVHQEGSTIGLEWQTPSRNQDGTTEHVDLREVRILRRVLDIDALVEAQTRPLEPPDEEISASVSGGEDEVASQEHEEQTEEEAEPESEEPSEDRNAPEESIAQEEPGAGREEPGEPAEEEGGVEGASPNVPARPALEIPAFASEAHVIATLPSTELGASLSFEEEVKPAWVGKRVEYAVRYSNRKKRASPLSRVVQIEPVEALEVPGAPVATVGDGFVTLRWDAGSRPQEEESFFVVYKRRGDAQSYPVKPLTPTPIDSPEFVDEHVVFGRRICYVVRRSVPPPAPAIVETEETEQTEETEEEEAVEPVEPVEPEVVPTELVPVVPPIGNPAPIESLPSEETCSTPEDTFAPAAPTGLAGVSLENGVLLTWDVVDADDLAGYRVYRASSPDGPFQLLNESIVTSASYTDESAEPGVTYYYAVTAVDSTERVNESARSESAEARRLSP